AALVWRANAAAPRIKVRSSRDRTGHLHFARQELGVIIGIFTRRNNASIQTSWSASGKHLTNQPSESTIRSRLVREACGKVGPGLYETEGPGLYETEGPGLYEDVQNSGCCRDDAPRRGRGRLRR